MESLRLVCDRDAQILLQKMESFTASFSSSMDSIKARAEETVQNQGELGRLKCSLTEADAEFVKVLADLSKWLVHNLEVKSEYRCFGDLKCD
ncbi:hypothetical protein OIU74_016849 [Salix koriyanagi]|uniref:Uncharacterized protein n=1 Tax=Salix koriyanagi TaxID=2511006 RepID=A0A9Q0SSX7_9ROSI|nr:hypothetical protein OIU74_016849 [Salix koriyanagi]